MKCHYCNRQAVKINIRETRTGSGTTVNSEHVCGVHAGLWSGRYDKPEEAGLIEMGVGSGNFRAKKTI
jgi:hypothetical protein